MRPERSARAARDRGGPAPPVAGARRAAWGALLALLLLVGCQRAPPALGGTGTPSVSAPLALAPDGTLWVVNPDADSVTPVDPVRFEAGAPIAVGAAPWSLAIAPDGALVVANRASGSLSVLRDGGRTRRDIAVGPEPGGVALSPSGRFAWVTLASAAEVARVDLVAERVLERVAVGPSPWQIAVSDDGDGDDADETVTVTHRFARAAADGSRDAWVTRIAPDGRLEETVIAPHAFGAAGVLEGIAVANGALFVAHRLDSPEPPHSVQHTVSAALTGIALDAPPLRTRPGWHLNDPALSTPVNAPSAVAIDAARGVAYVALGGSDALMALELSPPRLIGFWPTGANPRGVVLDRSGRRAFVLNYLSRDVSVLDLTDPVWRSELARIRVAPETLSPQRLLGAQLFHSARDPRMSRIGWVSCASCHPDGGADGVTWETADGPRQTMPLWGAALTAPFHASATRDEPHDVEFDIETLMGGVGLAPGAAGATLGPANAGRSAELDALADFVLHAGRVPAAPPGDAAAIARGRAAFVRAGCAGCHGGPAWTISALPDAPPPPGAVSVAAALRDVGTFDPTRDVLGAGGFDVPTLLGLHASAPYLHDGSAPTLAAVLAEPRHVGGALRPSERDDLIAFLRSIDAETEPVEPSP